MANTNLLTFAVHKAFISSNADTATPASWTELPIVAESTVEVAIGEDEVADGEGKLRYTWFHSQRANARLIIRQFAFRILELATSSPVSSAQGADEIEFGVDGELAPPVVRLKLICKARNDATNTNGYMHITVYKAQGRMPTLNMRATTHGEYEIMFKGLYATYNDLGGAISGGYGKVSGLKSTDTP
jgi:hypothetical protein